LKHADIKHVSASSGTPRLKANGLKHQGQLIQDAGAAISHSLQLTADRIMLVSITCACSRISQASSVRSFDGIDQRPMPSRRRF
jgi:hypothetical protein